MDKTLGISVVIGAALGKSYFRAVETAEQKSARLGRQWQATNSKLGATGAVIKYKNLLGQLRSKQAALGNSSKRLETGIQEVERRYKGAKRAAKSYGVEIGQVVREHGRLNRELKRTERQQKAQAKQQAAASRLGAMRGRMLGLVGAAYGASRLAGSAMAREEQGLYLRTVINAKDGDKDAAVARARQNAKAFARNSLASEQEVLEIEYALNSAGLQEETARAGTQLVHKLAKVTRGMPEQVGEIFGVTFNNMGESIEGTTDEKMQVIGNVLAKTQFKFQIRDFGQLGESLKYAAASASSAKLPLEQTAAIVGQLNSAGLQGSMAGTAFSAVLRNLGKASGELGFEIVRDEKGELDLIATLEQLKQQLDGMDTDERGDLLQKLFGDEGKRGVVPLIDQLDQLKAAHVEVANAARSGLVNSEYQQFVKSSSGQWQMFKQNIGQVGEVFASTLLPALNTILSPIGKLAGWVSSSIERFPIIGKAIGVIGAAFVGMGTVVAIVTAGTWAWNAAMASTLDQGIASWIRTIGVAMWGLAKGALPAVITGIRAMRVALRSNPIGLIIGGIALAAGLIYTFWEPIKGFFTGLWGGVENVFAGAWTSIKSGFLNFTPLGLLIKHWEPITGFFGGLWDGIKTVFAKGWEWIKSSFLAPLDKVKNVVGSVWRWITGDDDEAASTKVPTPNTARQNRNIKPAAALGAALTTTPVAADQVFPNGHAPELAGTTQTHIQNESHYAITVQPTPGMNERELATLVRQELHAQEQRSQANQRRVLHD